MQQVANTAFTLGAIGYSAAITLFLVDLARRTGSRVATRWAPPLLSVGAFMHGAHVTTVSLLTRTCPVGSVHFTLSLSGLMAVVGYLLMRKRRSLHAMGAVVAPTALAFMVTAEFVGTAQPVGEVNRSLLTFHVTANLLGLALLLLAGAAGALYIVHERQLKDKRIGRTSSRLPPLDLLDAALHRLLLIGFPLLTIGLVTGAVFMSRGAHATGAETVRAVLAYATWLLLALVLVLRRVAGWRGRKAAYGAIAGTLCILLVVALYATHPSMGDGL
jgi:ABC-type uncharacterized transport system permease subunit